MPQPPPSEQESQERMLKNAEENLRFFNNHVNLNAVGDFEGNLIRISPSWTKILGWTEEELRSAGCVAIYRDAEDLLLNYDTHHLDFPTREKSDGKRLMDDSAKP